MHMFICTYIYYLYYLSTLCGALNDNFLHRLCHLNAQFPDGDTGWGGLEDVASMEKITHWVRI